MREQLVLELTMRPVYDHYGDQYDDDHQSMMIIVINMMLV